MATKYKYYRVKSFAITGPKNAYYQRKQVFSTQHFDAARAVELLEQGHIVEISKSEYEEEMGPAKESAPASTDDLTVIKGVGARTAEKLAEDGIKSISDLAGANGEALEAKYDAAIHDWIAQAKELSS